MKHQLSAEQKCTYRVNQGMPQQQTPTIEIDKPLSNIIPSHLAPIQNSRVRGRKSGPRGLRIAFLAPIWYPIPSVGIYQGPLRRLFGLHKKLSSTFGGAERVTAVLVEALRCYQRYPSPTVFGSRNSQIAAKVIAFSDRSLTEVHDDCWHLKPDIEIYYQKIVNYLWKHQDNFDLLHIPMSFSEAPLFKMTELLSIPRIATAYTRFPMDPAVNLGTWTEAAQEHRESIARVPFIVPSQAAQVKMPSFIDARWVVYSGLPDVFFDYPLPTRENYVFWWGTYTPGKAPHLAIEVAKRAGIPIILAGIKNSSKQKEYYKRFIAPHVDGQRVRDLGPISLKESLYWISRARAFLNPWMWWEPGGSVISEALSLGCPILSFARGPAPEFIENGCGFLTSVRNPEGDELTEMEQETDYIEFLVNDMVKNMHHVGELYPSKEIRKRAWQKFAAEISAQHHDHIYREQLS